MGRHRSSISKKWTEEKEELLMQLLKKGEKSYALENKLGICRQGINNKLKTVGYKHITDAREKLGAK